MSKQRWVAFGKDGDRWYLDSTGDTYADVLKDIKPETQMALVCQVVSEVTRETKLTVTRLPGAPRVRRSKAAPPGLPPVKERAAPSATDPALDAALRTLLHREAAASVALDKGDGGTHVAGGDLGVLVSHDGSISGHDAPGTRTCPLCATGSAPAKGMHTDAKGKRHRCVDAIKKEKA